MEHRFYYEKYQQDSVLIIKNEVPEDLEIYVIESAPGYFAKEECESYRPESLQEWKHGYSKGIAITRKYKMISYWVLVW